MENLISKVWELGTVFGVKILAAIVILIVGRWILARRFSRHPNKW